MWTGRDAGLEIGLAAARQEQFREESGVEVRGWGQSPECGQCEFYSEEGRKEVMAGRDKDVTYGLRLLCSF